MTSRTFSVQYGSKAAHSALLVTLAISTMACAATRTTTTKMSPQGFVSRYSREAQAEAAQRLAHASEAERIESRPIDGMRIVHASGEIRIATPMDAYWRGEQMHVVLKNGNDMGIDNVDYVSIDYPKVERESNGTAIALLAVGAPIFLASGGLTVVALSSPSEGAIPVLFISPLVALGSLGLVIPGLVMLKSDSNQTAAWRRPAIQVYPGGLGMSMAF